MLKQLNGRELRLKRNHARLLEHQHKPRDLDLRTWLLLGGRGSGKTFAGSVWIDKMARKLPGITLALVGPALHDVREVMVEGVSGIKALAEPGDRPRWEAGRRRLVWGNQSAAYAFSAEDPDSLRGPQFHAAWADEFCAWRRPEMVLSNLRFGLRLGGSPLLAVTTTPRPIPALRRLMAEAGTVTERAATALKARLGHYLAVLFMLVFSGNVPLVFAAAIVPAVMAVAVLLIFVREPPGQGSPPAPVRLQRENLRLLGPGVWVAILIGSALTLARISEAFMILRASEVGLSLG